MSPDRRFPGGSRERVTRAGNNVRSGNPTLEDLSVIESWRYAHRHVLNSFQAILRTRVRETEIVVAQRHKRRRTIYDKLQRFPKMALGRMDDVAGCRLIFANVDQLVEFRRRLHGARFNHRLRNAPDKYDYIVNPKESGYRGVHDIYEYDVNSEAGKDYKGLYIELQYRTVFQHAWATAVEVVGHITDNQPKFDRGDDDVRRQLRLASEIIARAWEERTASLPDVGNEELVQEFVGIDGKTHLMQKLRALNTASAEVSGRKNVILVFSEDGSLEAHPFRDATDALRALFEMERASPGKDIVLVKGDSSGDVREAFKNYFSDARDFISLVDGGCRQLMDHRTIALEVEGEA